jgi:hypothetical protein
MFDGGEVQVSDVKQSEMGRLYARRETIWRRVIITACVAGPASGVGYALFGWKGIIPVACPWFLWVIWFLREDRRLTRAINAEQQRPATNTRTKRERVAAAVDIVRGDRTDPRKWSHGEVVERNSDGSPRLVWDRYKVTDFQGAKMVGAIVEASETLTNPTD